MDWGVWVRESSGVVCVLIVLVQSIERCQRSLKLHVHRECRHGAWLAEPETVGVRAVCHRR